MNKKKIIIISSVIIIICVVIGCVQHFTNISKDDKENISNTETITDENDTSNLSTNQSSQNDTADKTEDKKNQNNGESEKSNTENATNKVNSANSSNNKTETTKGQSNNHQSNNKPDANIPTSNNNVETTQKKEISVSLTISCKNALKYNVNIPASGYFLTTTTYAVKNGESLFDLLSKTCKQNGIRLDYEGSYITGIGGLYEKECTPQSGWMYRVNGKLIMKSANKYILNDGDKVEFYYVTSPKDMP